MKKKSYCPVYQSLNILGDKWSLLIIRDIMFHRKNHFNDFLTSKEKIAKSTLSNRLKKLVENSIIIKISDDTHKQKSKYMLTPKGVELTPIIAELYLFSGSLKDANLSVEDNRLIRALIDDKTSIIEMTKTALLNEAKIALDDNPGLITQY